MALMGIDIGTTGCKVSIVDYEGNLKGYGYREYPLISKQPGWYEMDPVLVWQYIRDIIREIMADYKGEAIKAVSASSLAEAVVPVDRERNILNNSLIYLDARGREEAALVGSRMDPARIHAITGAPLNPIYSVFKMMWLKSNMPEVYNKAYKFLLFADFALFMLGAEPHTDYSLATRTMAFDIIGKEWSDEILDCAGIDKNKFGRPVQAGTIVGTILPEIAEELGLPKDVVLVAGGHDQSCAALGCGVIEGDIAADGNGTVECITTAFSKPVISQGMAAVNLVCMPYVKKDMYVTLAFNLTSGSIMKWFRNNFAFEEKIESEKTGINTYDVLINKIPDEPTNLFLLPYFSGSGTPYMDADARGVLLGLDISTTKSEIVKAILEGITYEMMLNLENLDKAGIEVKELRSVGGMAKSDIFLQLKCDMLGKTVAAPDIYEAGTMGVAMIAGTACGIYASLDDAAKKLIRIKRYYYPDAKKHDIYMEKFQTYKRIYPATRSIMQV